MKRITFLSFAAFLLAGLLSTAQENTSGTVTYEEVRKIEIKLEGEMAHLMKDMPKEQREEKILYFSPEASLYTKIEKEEESPDMMGHGIRIMTSSPDNKLYIDLVNEEVIEKREFMTRNFLINGELPSAEWKITGQQKMILEHPCMEATKTDTAGILTRVWFAPGIAVKSGPSQYINLPGLVLEVDIEDGKQKYLARSIDFTAPEKSMFKKPKDGKKVTKEEFDKIVAEKMKEMGAERVSGSETQVMIRIQH